MKRIALCFVLILMGLLANAQIVKNPAYGMSTSPDVKILEIERGAKYTILRLFFETPPEYVVGGWVAVMRDMYIRDVDTGKRFYLKKVENVPYYPEKHIFTGPGQQLSFTLYFERVDLTVKRIDIIENVENGFNYFRVSMIDIAGVGEKRKDLSREYEKMKLSR